MKTESRKCNKCGMVAGPNGIRDLDNLKKFGDHINANGQLVPNNGIAFCPYCEDETLVEVENANP